jgi:hypothetical protein
MFMSAQDTLTLSHQSEIILLLYYELIWHNHLSVLFRPIYALLQMLITPWMVSWSKWPIRDKKVCRTFMFILFSIQVGRMCLASTFTDDNYMHLMFILFAIQVGRSCLTSTFTHDNYMQNMHPLFLNNALINVFFCSTSLELLFLSAS